MDKISVYTTKYLVIALILVGVIFGDSAFAAINFDETINKSEGNQEKLVCNVIGQLGLGCLRTGMITGNGPLASGTTVGGSNTNTTQSSNSVQNSNTSNSSKSSSSWFGKYNLSANVYTGTVTRKISKEDVSLVKVVGSPEVYEIVRGMKHLVPSEEIFLNYGYKKEMVREIPQVELNKYPRVRLVQPKGSKKVYYLTEAGFVRLVPDAKVYESYGDRKEDILVISTKEFNLYPVNQYVYLENPLNRDVFSVDGSTKKYLTPMAIRRMGLKEFQVTPVNQFEMSFYKTGEPIIN